jgi:hypothetical protein
LLLLLCVRGTEESGELVDDILDGYGSGLRDIWR